MIDKIYALMKAHLFLTGVIVGMMTVRLHIDTMAWSVIGYASASVIEHIKPQEEKTLWDKITFWN